MLDQSSLVSTSGRKVAPDDISALVEPIWASTLMRGETLFFIPDDDGNAATQLIYPLNAVISLTSAAGDIIYEEGRDFFIDNSGAAGGRARNDTARSIVLPRRSRIPITRQGDLSQFLRRADVDAFHRRQVVISYTHAPGLWHGCVPCSAKGQLPRTAERLHRGEPLTISLAGDSIAEGYNASDLMGVPPYQAAFGQLVAWALEESYGSPVTLHNFGVEGVTTDHGLYVDDLLMPQPDLVIIAYGMNDVGHSEAHEFAANIAEIMASIRRMSPHTEMILVSPMLPNPEWDYPVHRRLPEYRDALADLSGHGVALADMTTIWGDLLQRKNYYELSGNGLNHPNDFGHRIYAQVILQLFADQLPLEKMSLSADAIEAPHV